MKMYETTQSVERYLNIPLACDCGRIHFAPIKAVNVSAGALGSLPGYVHQFGYHNAYLLCDKITYEIAGKRCEELLRTENIPVTTRILQHLGFDEATLGEIVLNKPDDCELIIGCGTGSITDMLRFASFKLGLPCFTVCTAAPMDGFSASAGIMNVGGLKTTMPAHSTEVIIGDTDILSGAPYRMTIAGFGDLMAKLNAINDWHLGVLINGDHYCEKMDHLIMDYVHGVIPQVAGLKAHDPYAIGEVMNALLLTGLTISLYGDSRPISGAEHHMSHLWDALAEQNGQHFGMHGEQAAVGTVVALMVAEELSTCQPDFKRARVLASQYDPNVWEREIRRVYGVAADAIIELEKKGQKNASVGRLERIDRLEQHWDEVVALLRGVYPAQRLHDLLHDLGCPCEPKDINVSAELLKDTLLYCKETRARYTELQLAWDLGILDDVADAVIEKLRKANAFA